MCFVPQPAFVMEGERQAAPHMLRVSIFSSSEFFLKKDQSESEHRTPSNLVTSQLDRDILRYGLLSESCAVKYFEKLYLHTARSQKANMCINTLYLLLQWMQR